MSLNPALEDAKFCPRCGSPREVSFPARSAARAGYGAFYNPKPVACAIPATDDGELYLMRRGFEPSRGLWTMPGGFVDLGESVEDAAIRETKEEIGSKSRSPDSWGSTLEARIASWSSCTARAQGTPTRTEERSRFDLRPTTIPWHQLAFWSDGRALRDYFHAAATGAAAASSP